MRNQKQFTEKGMFLKHIIKLRRASLLGLLVTAAALGLGISACNNGDETGKTAAKEAEAGQLWTCGMHPQVIQDEPGNCPICGMKLTPIKNAGAPASSEHEHKAESEKTGAASEKKDRKILHWRAPMDPTYISEKPGKSPMGMDLVPVYEDEAASGPTISIDPVTVQNIGVKMDTVRRRPLFREIRTVAHLDYDEQHLYRVNMKFSGWIEKLYVDYTGQFVKKGQPLLEIYAPELVSTQEEYLIAYRNKRALAKSRFQEVSKSGSDLLASTRRRLRLWDVTEDQIKELEERGAVSRNMTLYAPASGIVVHKNAVEGMHANSGMDLYQIADLSYIWVYAHIYEYEAPWVTVGQEADMELPYVPGKTFKGRVTYIYPYLDAKTRDIKIRLEFPNPDLELKPQMYANVRISSKIGDNLLAIPDEAIINSGERQVAFVALGGGKFEPRDLRIGPESGDGYCQVLAGLQEGEVVVTSAQFLMDSESRMKEAIQKMLEAKKAGK